MLLFVSDLRYRDTRHNSWDLSHLITALPHSGFRHWPELGAAAEECEKKGLTLHWIVQRNAAGGKGETCLHHVVLCWVSRWNHGLGGTHRVSGWPVLLVWSLEPIFSLSFSDPNSSSCSRSSSALCHMGTEKNWFRCYRAPVKVDNLALCHISSYSSSVLGTNAAQLLERV